MTRILDQRREERSSLYRWHRDVRPVVSDLEVSEITWSVKTGVFEKTILLFIVTCLDKFKTKPKKELRFDFSMENIYRSIKLDNISSFKSGCCADEFNEKFCRVSLSKVWFPRKEKI